MRTNYRAGALPSVSSIKYYIISKKIDFNYDTFNILITKCSIFFTLVTVYEINYITI